MWSCGIHPADLWWGPGSSASVMMCFWGLIKQAIYWPSKWIATHPVHGIPGISFLTYDIFCHITAVWDSSIIIQLLFLHLSILLCHYVEENINFPKAYPTPEFPSRIIRQMVILFVLLRQLFQEDNSDQYYALNTERYSFNSISQKCSGSFMLYRWKWLFFFW
jgi:hypothetical protein